MTVFDVGAHVGELTLLFARAVGAENVHAFEASSATYQKLKSVCVLTGYSDVRVNHAAVTDRAGSVSLHVYDEAYSSWNTLANRPLQHYGLEVSSVGVEDVAAVTIDDYCARHDIACIDLLKIDVEGAEYQVLQGARRMLQDKRIRCLTFEFGQTTFDMGNSPSQIEDYLSAMGYKIRNVIKGAPTFPGRAAARTAQFSVHVAEPR